MEGQNAIIGVASVAMGWCSEGAFSPTFTSFLNIPLISLYIMVRTLSSLTFQPRKYGLYCLGCEPSALDVPSFFSMPIEGCYFGEVARHLYEQKREFECIPFYPSCVGLLVQAISTRLWPSVKTFRTHRHKFLSLWKKRQLCLRFGAATAYTRRKLLARVIRCMRKRLPPSWKKIESRTVEHRVTEVVMGMPFHTSLTDLWHVAWLALRCG